jgi:hypothetical protein
VVYGDERKRTGRRRIENVFWTMSKPRNVGLSWDQNGRSLFTAIRHPEYRRHECRSGFCGELEKLGSDDKGEGASGDPARPRVPMH